MNPNLTAYSSEALEKAHEYVAGGWKAMNDAIPSVASLAIHLKIRRATFYDWADKYPDWSALKDDLLARQERELLNQGLTGVFQPNLTKTLLIKHGYHDKIETDHTSSDGSMTPKAPVYQIVRE